MVHLPLPNAIMSYRQRSFPPELVDMIIDILHDDPETLKSCSVVWKSGIPRTRRYLFKTVVFRSPRHLESWKRIFPNPAHSPACYTRSLLVNCTKSLTAKDAEEGGWVQSFANVERLEVWNCGIWRGDEIQPCFTPLYNFSPTVKSLRIFFDTCPLKRVFEFVGSFPSLEDLDIQSDAVSDEEGALSQHSPFPPLTGTLRLCCDLSELVIRRLSDLPACLRFRKMVWRSRDFQEEQVMAFLKRCSNTLQYIHIGIYNITLTAPGSSVRRVDLSEASKLKEVVLLPNVLYQRVWVTETLSTLSLEVHQHLRLVSIYVDPDPENLSGHRPYGLFTSLDGTFVRLYEWHKIRIEAVCPKMDPKRRETTYSLINEILPRTMERGLIDIVFKKN